MWNGSSSCEQLKTLRLRFFSHQIQSALHHGSKFKVDVSKMSLPASILEKSRMSLMTVSKRSPLLPITSTKTALLTIERSIEQPISHADHAAHLSADLVAHVG